MIVVPDELAASHQKYFGAAGRRWIAALPGLAADSLARWDLRVDGPLGYGAVALVVPVVRRDSTPAVLKLQPVDEETRGEAIALRRWTGLGTVGLLEHDPAYGSMLLERLDAARSLATVQPDLAALRVIADLLAALNAVQAPAGMRRLADVAAATLDDAPTARTMAADPAERDLLGRCAAALTDLVADPIDDRLLHWDLHYDNVLAALDERPQPWVAIDPKPLAGDSGFELLPALWNRWDEIVATGNVEDALLRRFDLMTETLRLDRGRAATWTLGRVLQNAVWDLIQFGARQIEPAHRQIAEVLIARRA